MAALSPAGLLGPNPAFTDLGHHRGDGIG